MANGEEMQEQQLASQEAGRAKRKNGAQGSTRILFATLGSGPAPRQEPPLSRPTRRRLSVHDRRLIGLWREESREFERAAR